MVVALKSGHFVVSSDVQSVVESLLADLRIDRPPVDAGIVANALGFRIHQKPAEDPNRGYKMSDDSTGRIYVDQLDRPERVQWMTAHEIGELILPGRLESGDPAAFESLCNEFACELLLPRGWFVDDARAARFDLFELKALYSTASHEVIAKRMLIVADPPAIVSIFDHGRMRSRVSNLPWKAPRLSFVEGVVQRAVNSTGESFRESAGGMDVAGWPVHDRETGWKREILRTVIDEFAGESASCEEYHWAA